MRSKLLVGVLFSTLMACGVDDSNSAGPGKLTSAEPEPAGAHCAAGGVAVHTVIDENGNGVTDAGEPYSTTYTCNHASLLREDTIGSGAVCPGGGVLVHSGHDTNDNGSLQDAEIEQTATVCHSDEIYRGELKTSDFSSDTSRERLSHVRVVTGNVLFDSAAPMPSLEMVGGNIELRAASLVELPKLERIVGNLTGPPGSLLGQPGIARGGKLSAPALTSIGGYVSLSPSGDQGVFSAPSLTAVDGKFLLTGKITTIELGKLARVGGDLDFDVQPATLSLPALQNVAGSVVISGWFTGLDLHALETATSFNLVYSSLPSLSLPALKTSSTIRVTQSAPMTSVEMPLVSGVKWLVLSGMPKLAVVDLPLVTEVDKLAIGAIGSTDLGMFAQLRAVKSLTIQANPQLANLGGLEQLTTMTSLTISNNPKLADLGGLDHLAAVTGNLTITKNGSLTSLGGLATLTNVSRQIAISENAMLPQAEVDAFLHRLGR